MADENVPMPSELVVIRRRSGEEGDGHHGGAWKIAYADFMTAMMAFFLVMWLINTADKKTIERIATYFNPMRMADQSTHRKGLQDLDAEAVEGNIATVKTKEERTGEIIAAAKENATKENKEPAEKAPSASHSKEAREKAEKIKASKDKGAAEKGSEKASDKSKEKSKEQAKEQSKEQSKDKDKDKSKSKGQDKEPATLTETMEKARGKERGLAAPSASLGARRFSDEELFSNPYGSLDQLAADVDITELSPATADRPGSGLHRDTPKKDAIGSGAEADLLRDLAMPGDVMAPERGRGTPGQQARRTPPTAGQLTPAAPQSPPSPEQTDVAVADKPASPDAQQRATPPPASTTTPADASAAAAQLAAAVAAEVAEITKSAKPGKAPHLEVTPTPEGTLISITDEFDFGMFAIGSAEPRPEVVAVMGRIGDIIQRHSGTIVVRGHTDGRQYKSGAWDNWRLSASRAQMAYHMLVRGGLQATRIERIEGHADRSLKVAADPLAARNRRIEILLKGS